MNKKNETLVTEMYRDNKHVQMALMGAKERISQLQKQIEMLAYMRSVELDKLQSLVNRTSFITPEELVEVFGDAIKVPKPEEEATSE